MHPLKCKTLCFRTVNNNDTRNSRQNWCKWLDVNVHIICYCLMYMYALCTVHDTMFRMVYENIERSVSCFLFVFGFVKELLQKFRKTKKKNKFTRIREREEKEREREWEYFTMNAFIVGRMCVLFCVCICIHLFWYARIQQLNYGNYLSRKSMKSTANYSFWNVNIHLFAVCVCVCVRMAEFNR